VNGDLSLAAFFVNAETGEHFFDRRGSQDAIDHKTESAFTVMLHNIDNRFGKARIFHVWQSHQKPTGERVLLLGRYSLWRLSERGDDKQLAAQAQKRIGQN
jgi:hypothetical protein